MIKAARLADYVGQFVEFEHRFPKGSGKVSGIVSRAGDSLAVGGTFRFSSDACIFFEDGQMTYDSRRTWFIDGSERRPYSWVEDVGREMVADLPEDHFDNLAGDSLEGLKVELDRLKIAFPLTDDEDERRDHRLKIAALADAIADIEATADEYETA